ncbi:diguanylate cyclase domain-containing protein [Pseudooceanicola algae]|nr:GGDEF domain-containing protein [Pseudooceanicola algae]
MLFPMHLRIDAAGMICHAGPTMQKLRPDQAFVGRAFLDMFELTQRRAIASMPDLLAEVGRKLRLRLRDAPRTALKGLVVPVEDGGAILNASFGISFGDALRTYPLHSGDFAPTDLTIELLYLAEANAAVTQAYRKLGLRLQGAKIAAEEQAYTDTLTGLKNRRAMDHVLARLIRSGQSFSLTHLDLDYFKQVNDSHGHAAGDFVLQHVAALMVGETREADIVARVGGDEFVLIFPRLIKRHRIEEIARRLIDRLEVPVQYDGRICRISCSMGTTLSTFYDPPRAEQMLADADRALYLSKKAGRAQHRFFDPDPVARPDEGRNAG